MSVSLSSTALRDVHKVLHSKKCQRKLRGATLEETVRDAWLPVPSTVLGALRQSNDPP